MEYIYLEDNDPKHAERVVKQWYREESVNRMDWPAQPHMENLWFLVDHRLKGRAPSTKAELYKELQQGWRL